jgi:hypothetical protein
MPYIEQADRKPYTDVLDQLPRITSVGDLNFVLTTIYLRYFNGVGGYGRINDVIGAIESSKLEFYRRVAVPFENEKIIVNGDVYGELT